MAEVGLLAPDSRVELIEGEIIDMAPIGSPHASVVTRLNHLLVQAVGERALVSVQLPVRLTPQSEPQPDLAVLKPRADFYRPGHPTPADVLLLIEVSHTTLRYDRNIKVPLYARHGIPEVWLIDLENGKMDVFRSPAGEIYSDVASTTRPGVTPISLLSGVAVDLSGLLE